MAGEELGFVGCFAILLLLFLIVLECILIGRRAKDQAGTLICCGVASLVAVQSFINICVATGLMPNTGTPAAFCQLWSDLSDQPVYRDGTGPECGTADQKLLWR